MPYTTRGSVRLGPRERDLLETAAKDSQTTLSDFIRRESVEAAKIELLDRSIVTIAAKGREKFKTGGNRPA